ncbi:MAG: quinone-dependent dihydroorotate dehydrogenase [Myxococcales bacterium]|nr:quinone-dependent dihydroorotate dehydrogenase [Myxococcales bacterium]
MIRSLLFRLEAEQAHAVAMLGARVLAACAVPLLRRLLPVRHPALEQRRLGLLFPGPVGLAAGLDKDARAWPLWEALGFGFCEIGSVSARPCAGNPRPRLFRLPADQALVNRLGLPSDGAMAVAARLQGPRRVPLGINVAKTHDPALCGLAAIEDFCHSYRCLAPRADYVTLNVSCPNTPDGRTFEEPAALEALLSGLAPARREAPVPLLLKLSPPAGPPDLGHLAELLAVARAFDVAGLVIANTTPARDGLRTPAEQVRRLGPGGLSGPPLAARAEALLRAAYRLSDGRLTLIGVGGIDSAEAAYRRLRAGASLLQLYTALVYHGPGLVRSIHRGLLALVRRDGLDHVAQAVGLDA